MKHLLSFFLFLSVAAQAQEKKVGLVFSGGGARCMAQIGALKVMEEEGVQFDHLGGTSMGAIFAALVAQGYTSDDILKLILQVDWQQLQNDNIPRERLSYSDKKRDERYVFSLGIKDWQVMLPKGLNSGHYVLQNLDFLMQKGNDFEDFNQLPIPFFCVATELIEGKLHIFDSGSLTAALRASSSFPSIFFPVKMEDKLYVDGGVIDNFPVKTMKEKGVDIIIGVDVQNPSYSIDELNNAFRILEQISTLNNYHSGLKADSLVDVLIRLEQQNVGLFDFHEGMNLYALGYQMASEQREALRNIAKQQKKRELTSLPLPSTEVSISRIELLGDQSKGRRWYRRELGLNKPGKLSIDKLNRRMDEWKGGMRYESISYQLVQDTGGYHKLIIDAKIDSVKNRLHAAARYDDDFGAALLLSYSRRDLFFENAHLHFDFAVSENPRTWLEYSTNLGAIPSAGIRFRAHRFRPRIYEEGEPSSEFRYTDASADFFLRSTIADVWAVGGGLQLEEVNYARVVNELPITNPRSGFINYYAFTDLDTYDRNFKPTKGLRINGMYRIIAERVDLEEFFEPTSVLSVFYSQALSWRKSIGLEWWARGAFTIGPEVAYPYNIFLGGLGENYINYSFPFIGYRFMELIGRNAATVGANFYVHLGKENYITAKANWGKLEASYGELFDDGVLLDGYGLSYGLNTPIGPLEINVMTSSNHWNIYTYFTLGYWF